MAKAMTKSQVVKALADAACLTRKQVAVVLEAMAALAYKQAKNGFTVPGLGKLVLVKRPARKMVMRFGPKAGQTINVPAKSVLRFRVSKAAKDAVLKK